MVAHSSFSHPTGQPPNVSSDLERKTPRACCCKPRDQTLTETGFVSAWHCGEWSPVRLALAAPYSVTPLKANAHVRKRAPCDKGVAAVSFSQEELTGGRLLAFNMLRGRGRRCHRGSHYHPLSSNAVRSCSSSASRRWRGIRSPRASRPSPPRLRLPRRSTPS